MQLLVLGMHRSGTSVLARILNLMGAWFGPEGISTGANRENPKGFWERRDVRALNDAVLHAAGCDWNRVADFDLASVPEEAIAEFRAGAATLLLELDAHRPWFLKEPRLCLLFPLWRPLLEAPVCIHMFRHPLEVAASLSTRNGMPIPFGLALWEKYVACALHDASGLPSVGVFHHRLMADPMAEIERLHGELCSHGVVGLRVPSSREVTAFIDPGLHRERKANPDLLKFDDEPQVRMFEALQHGSTAPPATGAISENSLQRLRRYERRLPPLQPDAGKPPSAMEVLRERLRASGKETRQLQERVVARDQENRLLRQAVEKAEQISRDHDKRRSDELVVLGRLREKLERQEADTAAQRRQHLEAYEQQAQAHERQLQAKEAASSELEFALRQSQQALDERFRELAELSRMLFEVEDSFRVSLATRDGELAVARQTMEAMRNSRTWRLTSPLRAIGRRRRRGGRDGDIAGAVAVVEDSGLFDRGWYLERNADVAGSGMDPVVHYLGFGAAEGRDPGPGFDTAAYLERNPDVREADINPLLHYLLHGKQEGRLPK